MELSKNFMHDALVRTIVVLTDAAGFEKISEAALEVLVDIFYEFMISFAKNIQLLNEPDQEISVNDGVFILSLMSVNFSELHQYISYICPNLLQVPIYAGPISPKFLNYLDKLDYEFIDMPKSNSFEQTVVAPPSEETTVPVKDEAKKPVYQTALPKWATRTTYRMSKVSLDPITGKLIEHGSSGKQAEPNTLQPNTCQYRSSNSRFPKIEFPKKPSEQEKLSPVPEAFPLEIENKDPIIQETNDEKWIAALATPIKKYPSEPKKKTPPLKQTPVTKSPVKKTSSFPASRKKAKFNRGSKFIPKAINKDSVPEVEPKSDSVPEITPDPKENNTNVLPEVQTGTVPTINEPTILEESIEIQPKPMDTLEQEKKQVEEVNSPAPVVESAETPKFSPLGLSSTPPAKLPSTPAANQTQAHDESGRLNVSELLPRTPSGTESPPIESGSPNIPRKTSLLDHSPAFKPSEFSFDTSANNQIDLDESTINKTLSKVDSPKKFKESHEVRNISDSDTDPMSDIDSAFRLEDETLRAPGISSFYQPPTSASSSASKWRKETKTKSLPDDDDDDASSSSDSSEGQPLIPQPSNIEQTIFPKQPNVSFNIENSPHNSGYSSSSSSSSDSSGLDKPPKDSFRREKIPLEISKNPISSNPPVLLGKNVSTPSISNAPPPLLPLNSHNSQSANPSQPRKSSGSGIKLKIKLGQNLASSGDVPVSSSPNSANSSMANNESLKMPKLVIKLGGQRSTPTGLPHSSPSAPPDIFKSQLQTSSLGKYRGKNNSTPSSSSKSSSNTSSSCHSPLVQIPPPVLDNFNHGVSHPAVSLPTIPELPSLLSLTPVNLKSIKTSEKRTSSNKRSAKKSTQPKSKRQNTGNSSSSKSQLSEPGRQHIPVRVESVFSSDEEDDTKLKNKDSFNESKFKTNTEVVASAGNSYYFNANGDQIWLCPVCSMEDDGNLMIGCDNCDDWYHGVCLGMTSEPDTSEWFCPKCSGRPLPPVPPSKFLDPIQREKILKKMPNPSGSVSKKRRSNNMANLFDR